MNLKHLLLLLCCCFMGMIPAQAQTGQYLHFDGDDDYVLLPNASQYLIGATEISMTGWFYTDELTYGQGMMGLRNGNQGFYLIQLADGILECRLNSTDGLSEYVAPAFSVLPEQWQHFAWIYDGSNITLYIDGEVSGSSAASGTFTDGTVGFAVGRSILSNLDFYFKGRADEVTLWTKALSEADIKDMMANELNGDEEGLQLYYKFNQGIPADDNTTINKAICKVGNGERDADLLNFAMTGEESNFNGDLDESFQAISFPAIPNKLISDVPFMISANASSGLPVSFEVISGPAAIDGDNVILTGETGEVVIEASQRGDATFSPAAPIRNSFFVIDPAQNVPTVRLTNPINNEVIVGALGPIPLTATADINFKDLFEITGLEFEINGEIIPATEWKDKHYTAYWIPTELGAYTVTIRAFNNYDSSSETIKTFTVKMDEANRGVTAFSNVLVNTGIASQQVTAKLPSYVGAYSKITANLEVDCPAGQPCGEWDRVARVKVKTHEGEWIELIKYITPYGKACSHSLDVTDFFPVLQGEVEFIVECVTFDTGYEYTLSFDYEAGEPDWKYGHIAKLWHGAYDFGNMNNLQPVENISINFPENTQGAKIKLVASGHGWGDNNTNNAAEFSENSHHIWVNGAETFAYDNWFDCNPNPDGCSPQNGTWSFNRAGFCPGAISPFTDFDVSSYVNDGSIDLGFRMDEDYVDLCHVNNPDCVSGVTCNDCNDGFNPHLIFASTLISYASFPLNQAVTSTRPTVKVNQHLRMYPNPTSGVVALVKPADFNVVSIVVYDLVGKQVQTISNPSFNQEVYYMNLEGLDQGMYFVKVVDVDGKVLSGEVVVK